MAKNSEHVKNECRPVVWIELPPPANHQHADELCRKLNRMLHRLTKPSDLVNGALPREFFYDRSQACYCYGGDMGYTTLSDRGVWLNLDYLAGVV